MQTEPPNAGPPKGKRRWLQFSLGTVLIVVTLLFVWLRINQRSHFSMIASDVAKMKATFHSPDSVIEIQNAKIPLVLEALSNAKEDRNPFKWAAYGDLECRMKSGEIVEIDLFYVDGEEMALRTDQEHYFRGADAKKVFAIVKTAGQVGK